MYIFVSKNIIYFSIRTVSCLQQTICASDKIEFIKITSNLLYRFEHSIVIRQTVTSKTIKFKTLIWSEVYSEARSTIVWGRKIKFAYFESVVKPLRRGHELDNESHVATPALEATIPRNRRIRIFRMNKIRTFVKTTIKKLSKDSDFIKKPILYWNRSIDRNYIIWWVLMW